MSEKEDLNKIGPPIIRGELINTIWESIFKMIFNDVIKPPLTFEEVHIIQHRLDEHVEAIKAQIHMDMMFESKQKPINDSSYVK